MRAERVTEAGQVDGEPFLRGHVLQQRTHRFKGDQDFAPDLMRGAHGVHRNQDPPLAIPRDNRRGHLMVESKALSDDLRGVVGAML